MANVLGISVSGLISLQQAISTTGNNVVNANTEGYSRQRVDFGTQPTVRSSSGFVGNGVRTTGIRRVYDEFLVQQVRDYTASASSLGTQAELTARLDQLLADPSAGFTTNLQKFFGTLQDVANNPTSLPERQVLISEAESLGNQVQFLESSFDSLNSEVNTRLGNVIEEINLLAQNLSRINEQVSQLSDRSPGKLPNDLFDARDELLRELGTKTSVTTVEQEDGSLNVLIGNGQQLVIGSRVTRLAVLSNEYDGNVLEIGFAVDNGPSFEITGLVKGGELEGLLEFRQEVLNPARDQLGLAITGLASAVNDQHKLGLDLNGNPGQNFFASTQPLVLASIKNTGTATVSATISDVSALPASDFRVRFDGTDWQVIQESNGSSSTGPLPRTVSGIDIDVTGVAVSGDSYVLRPTRAAASGFSLNIGNPSNIAAASMVRSATAGANSGDASLNDLAISSAVGLPLATAVTLTFNPNALGAGVPGFDVIGGPGGVLAYDPATDVGGKQFTFPGVGEMSFTLKGSPASGDVFSIENNIAAVGDNRNALAMANLQTVKSLESNRSTVQDVYGHLVAEIAVRTRQTEVGRTTEIQLLQTASSARESVSGVNLDEEAANLLRFQQAYQAAAQMVQVAQTIFQTLINATR